MTGPSAPADLAHATWVEVEARAPLVLVPIGATEQHGPHLPLETDTAIAVAVAAGAATALRETGVDVVVAPALAYGASGEHQDFPGTVSMGTAALQVVLVELVRSLHTWAGPVVLVNGHGGNLPALRAAVEQLVAEGHDVSWVPCGVPGADLHAGRHETSLMLHLDPGSVRLDRAEPGADGGLGDLLPAMIAHGVRAVSPSGVLGDPTEASAAEGEALLAAMVERVVAAMVVVG